MFLSTIHCAWTPEVKTLIHSSEEGSVILQTSSTLNIPPQHPQVLSESLIKQILQGISQSQESGILQELFLSDSQQFPVFSRPQIDFLAPHLVEAFSKATSEELITFRSPGDEEGATRVSGTVAVFSPTVFFLTLQNPGNYPGNPSKMTSSSRNLQKHTTLMFSKKQAILQPEEGKRLMTISPRHLWIAIDYAAFGPLLESEQKDKKQRTIPPITNPQIKNAQSGMNTLQEQLQNLRKRVDEQAEEIRPLLPLQFLNRPRDPLPDGAAVHVTVLQHGVGALGSLQGGARPVLVACGSFPVKLKSSRSQTSDPMLI